MNLVQKYVTNITDEKEYVTEYGTLYKLICDTNCYGRKEYQVSIILTDSEYEEVKTKGYYLT